MKILLVSLCSLLLCASVTSHPVTRHRGVRARNPLPQRIPKPTKPDPGLPEAGLPEAGLPEASLPEAGLPDTSLSEDESISIEEDSSVVMDIPVQGQGTTPPALHRRLYAVMTRGRKGGCRKCSEEKHDSRPRPNSKSEDIEDWLEMTREHCGPKLEMIDQLEKVSPMEVKNVMTSADDATKTIADSFSRHRDDIAKLEANMKGQSVDQLISAHIDLLERFGSLVESGMKNGMCEFASMQMLLDRIANLGSVDFADSRCNEAYRMVAGSDVQPEKIMWLFRFGEALRSDMYCIINDIEALSKQVSSIRNIFEHEQNPSLRYINIGISTVMAYEGILGNELVQFRHAIDLVGDALQYVDFEELEAQAMGMRKRDRIMNAMMRLQSKA